MSVEAQGAIEGLLKERGGEIPQEGMPRIRSDNGSCYISREFRGVLFIHKSIDGIRWPKAILTVA